MSAATAAASAAEEARKELAACEKEIANIKAALHSLGQQAQQEGDEDAASNSLSVAWLKIEGLPETVEPKLSLQLSSPIEEIVLMETFIDDDTTTTTTTTDNKKGGMAVFRSVETGQATLTVTAQDNKNNNNVLGSSTAYDLAPLTKFDAMNPQKTEIVTELDVAINVSSAAAEQQQEEKVDVVCTVAIRITFRPSTKDRREELYELLNKTTQRRAAAVEALRRTAMEASRAAQQQSGSGGGAMTTSTSRSPAVRSGFLNKDSSATKKQQQQQETKWQAWYNRNLGPDSLVRKIMPVAKNYILFAGFCVFMHFRGQMLALPPPV